jgi:DNA-directed RNA polymerase beta' subunit
MRKTKYLSDKILMEAKKMNKKILGLAAVFVVLLTIGTAMAFGGNFMGTATGFNSDVIQQIKTAITNNDFPAWKQLHESMLTEENFNALKERTQERNQNREEMQLMQQEIQTAIENGDYEAWVSLMQENNNPRNEAMLSAITEDNFSLLKEMHQAMQSGDFETANQIREELGIQNMGKSRFRGMHGMKGNFGDCPFAGTETE